MDSTELIGRLERGIAATFSSRGIIIDEAARKRAAASVLEICQDLTYTPLEVVCDHTNNSEADREAGILVCDVFPCRPLYSLEFIITKDGIQTL